MRVLPRLRGGAAEGGQRRGQSEDAGRNLGSAVGGTKVTPASPANAEEMRAATKQAASPPRAVPVPGELQSTKSPPRSTLPEELAASPS